LLSDHGLIALDNMLQSGRVLDPESDPARAIDDLNRQLGSDERLTSVLLTVRDGLTLVRKRAVGA
jgi:caffeoyl-CoA O-methyltransferase